MDSPRQNEDVKSQVQVAADAKVNPPVPVTRRYPTPPPLWRRLVSFCLHPESWALAARYPTRFTIITLAAAILLAGLIAGLGEGIRLDRSLKSFGANYESAGNTPLELSSDGVLKATGEWHGPIRYTFGIWHVVVDPTGATTPQNLKLPGAILINDRSWITCGPESAVFSVPLSMYKQSDGPTVINGDAIRGWSSQLAIEFGLVLSLCLVLGNILWAAAAMFLISPLLMAVAASGQRGLSIPRRAAYRMIAACLVPLVLFGSLMQAAGFSIMDTLGGEPGLLFWFAAAAAMSIYTALTAKRLYAPAIRPRRGQ